MNKNLKCRGICGVAGGLLLMLLTGCATPRITEMPTPERMAMYRAISAEPPGDYYIGRRYYKQNIAVWGYVRRPRQPWHEAQMVLLNEDRQFAYDREQGTIGIDDGYEYRLYGRFGGTVYEPASNNFYPEFILRDYEIIDRDPPSIFGNNYIHKPGANTIVRPQKVNPAAFPQMAVAPATGASPNTRPAPVEP